MWNYNFVRAQVEEYGGDRAAALASYRWLLIGSAGRRSSGGTAARNLEHVEAAIRRLGG
jgi:hypothetical protein